MNRWVSAALSALSNLWLSLIVVMAFGTGAVAVRFAAEYLVNDNRDVSYWVEYESVVPVSSVYPVGSRPIFFSKATWHHDVQVSWPDVMWCEDSEGPDAGILRRLTAAAQNRTQVRNAGLVGHYDEAGSLIAGSSSGFWQWDGHVPEYPSVCWLAPSPVLHPSPGVERPVPVPPTTTFEFR